MIQWKDFEMSDHILDPVNLSPEIDIQDNPDLEYDSDLADEFEEGLQKMQNNSIVMVQ